MKNRVIKLIGIIVLIILLIFGLIFCDRKSQKNADEENVITEKKEEQRIDLNESKNIEVIFDRKNSWDGEAGKYFNYDIIIKNNSKEEFKNWKLILNPNYKCIVDKVWNIDYKVDNEKIEITTSESYGINILPNSQFSFGGIFAGSSELNIENFELYSDNKLICSKKSEEEEKKIEKPIEEIENNEIKNIDIEKNSPLGKHGKISVKNQNIIDKSGKEFQIQGISTHSIAHYSQYINKECFKYLRDEMNVNTIRLALYSAQEDGFSSDLYPKVSEAVEYATELGLYVVLDWHVLNDNDPNINKENAKQFFTIMAEKYKDNGNILYEICNEPNVDWSIIKTYAEEMIPVIRNIDKDGIIIIGTPFYCQKVDEALKDPIKDFENILYSFHFYSGTHGEDLRDVVKNAYDEGLPIIVSEFGLSEASGNGNINTEEGNLWLDYFRENGIGYICWNLSNKDETSAILKSETESFDGSWNDENLSEQGLWIKNKYNN